MTSHKILCPIDFSPGSQQAMRMAIRLANEADAELVLGHAWYVPPVAFSGEHVFAPAVMQELNAGAQEALDHAVREAKELGAKRLSSWLLAGMPRHEIIKLLEHDPAFDLVVMGTHGRTGLGRILLGSIAESIVRHAPCSVLAVRPDAELKPFARVLCPVDLAESSEHAVELAAALVQPGSEGITLLHVIEPPPVYGHAKQTLDFIRDLDRYSTEHLATWAARLEGKAPAPVAKRSRVGHPGAEILRVLDEGPAFDLVVMGSHSRTGIERMLLGSVAEKVVRHARCPVLIARRRTEPR
ncbi:MAG TPA: universal stress protein [Kofleriaceae bacterium]|nr:universal stress protein [Kofleriaceae bacterium]